MQYICENCKIEHNGQYASGRFCSKKCAKGFSTKAKRREINKKVSNTIIKKLNNGETIGWAKKIYTYEERKCLICGVTYTTKTISKRKYCRICAYISPEFRSHASEIRIQNILNGKVEKFGKSRKCVYPFKDKMIRCDSKLEYCAVKYIDENFNVLLLERCNFSIPYKDFLGCNRKFIPDFFIKTDKSIIIMECKYEKINYQLNEKWTHYLENIPLKRTALQEYCDNNHYDMLWFTDKTEGLYKKIKQKINFY
jgi:hypothetical protein